VVEQRQWQTSLLCGTRLDFTALPSLSAKREPSGSNSGSAFSPLRLSWQGAAGSREFCTLQRNPRGTRELSRGTNVPPAVCCTARAACSTL
jgi:hypothetical protein